MRSELPVHRIQSTIADAVYATGNALKRAGTAVAAFPANVYNAYTRPRSTPLTSSERLDVIGFGFGSAVANAIPGAGWLISALWGGALITSRTGEGRAKGYEILGATTATIAATGLAYAAGYPLVASALVAGAVASTILATSTVVDACRGRRGDIG